MLDLFLKLIDRLLELARHREAISRQTYSDFVAPALEEFEAVHKHTMDSLSQLVDSVLVQELPIVTSDPLVERLISLDLEFRAAQAKAKALQQIENLDELQELPKALSSYFSSLREDGGVDSGWLTVAIRETYLDIKTLFLDGVHDPPHRQVIVRRLRETQELLTERHARIVKIGIRVKRDMLKPI